MDPMKRAGKLPSDPRIAQLRKVLKEAGYFVNGKIYVDPRKEGRRYKMQVVKKGKGMYVGKISETDRGMIEKLVKSIVPEARLYSSFVDYSVTYVWIYEAEPTPYKHQNDYHSLADQQLGVEGEEE